MPDKTQYVSVGRLADHQHIAVLAENIALIVEMVIAEADQKSMVQVLPNTNRLAEHTPLTPERHHNSIVQTRESINHRENT